MELVVIIAGLGVIAAVVGGELGEAARRHREERMVDRIVRDLDSHPAVSPAERRERR